MCLAMVRQSASEFEGSQPAGVLQARSERLLVLLSDDYFSR
jgi:hypothetical protein